MSAAGLPTLYVSGGEQKRSAHGLPEWSQFRRALLVRVDPGADEARVALSYETPPEARPDEDPSILFKAGSVSDGTLWIPTQTEVLAYRLPRLRPAARLSLPLFNDLHHVAPTARGTLLVAVTGLDMVVETTPDGAVLREWDVLGGDPWERFDPATDWRKVASTKPHASHPNYVFELDGRPWTTRFHQRDAICLDDPDDRIAIDVERPHDGVLREGTLWFTTVDGQVVTADAASRAVTDVCDLNAIHDHGRPLGWCRGVLPVGGRRAVVGFSRLRPTRFQANVAWVKGSLKNLKSRLHLPTRIALYDLDRRACLWEKDLEETGLSVVFSIHAA